MLTRSSAAYTRTIPAPPPPADAVVRLPGVNLNVRTQLGLDGSHLARGLLLLGASRSGKSVTQSKMIAQVRQRLTPNDILLILDTKGEYAARFYRPGDVILGLGGPYRPTDTWNLLRDCSIGCRTAEQLRERCNMIAEFFFMEKENTQTPYFTDAPMRLLSELLYTLIRRPELLPEGEKLDNTGLLAFIRRGNWENFLQLCSAPAEMESYIGRAGHRSQAERSVLAELNVNVSRTLINVWGSGGGFSVIEAEQRRGGRTIFLQYNLEDGSASDPAYAMILNLMLLSFMTGKHPDGKFYLFLDEVSLLGKSPTQLVKALNYGPGIGLGCVCISAQSIAQLQEMCGTVQASALLAGLQSRLMFHVEDELSRDYVRGECGRVQPVHRTYVPGISYNVSVGSAEEPAVTDVELNTLSVGQAIVKLPGRPAFFFHFDK